MIGSWLELRQILHLKSGVDLQRVIGPNPRSAVQRSGFLIISGLPILGPDFRHYIADQVRALRQAQAEVAKQLGRCRFGRGHHAQAKFG